MLIRNIVRKLIVESIEKNSPLSRSDVEHALKIAVIYQGEKRNKELKRLLELIPTQSEKEDMMDIISNILSGNFDWDKDFYGKGYTDGLDAYHDRLSHDKHFTGIEAPSPDIDLGQYVWPENHFDIRKDIEPNTDIENKIKKEIASLLAARKEGVYYQIGEDVFSAIKKISLEGTYYSIFRPVSPNEKNFVYRGMVMERDRFENIFGKIENDVGSFIQQAGRNIKNTFYKILNYIGFGEKKGKEAIVDQINPGKNNIYSDLKYMKDESSSILDAEKATNAHSFWTPSMKSAFSYALKARNMAGFEDPVMFILTASTNTSDFLDLDLIINQYDFAKNLSKQTPRGEYMLIGDAIINNVYVLYDQRLKRKIDKPKQPYLSSDDWPEEN